MSPTILSPEEWDAAWKAGEERHRHHCTRKGVRVTVNGLRLEAVGAIAEFAASRVLGGKADMAVGRAHYGGTDVIAHDGTKIEVKATEWGMGRLLIYSDTPDELPVVLAIVHPAAKMVTLAGWLRAKDGKYPVFWRPDFKTPCYAVDQHLLRPMEELPCFQSLHGSPSPPPSPTD